MDFFVGFVNRTNLLIAELASSETGLMLHVFKYGQQHYGSPVHSFSYFLFLFSFFYLFGIEFLNRLAHLSWLNQLGRYFKVCKGKKLRKE